LISQAAAQHQALLTVVINRHRPADSCRHIFGSFSMKSVAFLVGVASVALSTAAVSAQSMQPSASKHSTLTRSNSSGSQTPLFVVQPFPYAGWWHSHAATIEESRARGAADYIRALGEYDRTRAAAAIDREAAREAAIANWKSQVRANWEVRDAHKARELAENPPLTPEQQLALTRARDPKRLSPSQISAGGTINWPTVLQATVFEVARSRLDELFAQRARGVSPAAAAEIARLVDAEAIAMTQTLADAPNGIEVMERVAVGDFINSLRLEARQVVDAGIARQVVAAKQ
jgi:hypothetical protein